LFRTFDRGQDMKKLYTARDAMEAHFLRTLLEERDIPAAVLGENLAPARGELPFTLETQPAVWVNDDDLADAQAVVDDMLARRGARDLAPPWTCPACHEFVDATFELCWNCQADRPAS
jgi:hypothetical protein